MKDLINNTTDFLVIGLLYTFIILFIGIAIGINSPIFNNNENNIIKSEQWGGAVPMKIYTVYDKDTGVYYAVTEKGGICVMETMSGETKLVDEGEPPIIHKNQGLNE